MNEQSRNDGEASYVPPLISASFSQQSSNFDSGDEYERNPSSKRSLYEANQKEKVIHSWRFANDYSRDEEKKKQKIKSNAVKKLKERERREKMADLIDELRVLIPNCGDNGKKLNQSNVMSYAVEYIKNLHSAVVEMKQEIFFLKGGQGVCPPSTPLVPSLDRHMNQNNSEENEPTQEVSIASKPDREAKKNGSQSPQPIFSLGDIEDVGEWPLYFQNDKILNCDWLDSKVQANELDVMDQENSYVSIKRENCNTYKNNSNINTNHIYSIPQLNSLQPQPQQTMNPAFMPSLPPLVNQPPSMSISEQNILHLRNLQPQNLVAQPLQQQIPLQPQNLQANLVSPSLQHQQQQQQQQQHQQQQQQQQTILPAYNMPMYQPSQQPIYNTLPPMQQTQTQAQFPMPLNQTPYGMSYSPVQQPPQSYDPLSAPPQYGPPVTKYMNPTNTINNQQQNSYQPSPAPYRQYVPSIPPF